VVSSRHIPGAFSRLLALVRDRAQALSPLLPSSEQGACFLTLLEEIFPARAHPTNISTKSRPEISLSSPLPFPCGSCR